MYINLSLGYRLSRGFDCSECGAEGLQPGEFTHDRVVSEGGIAACRVVCNDCARRLEIPGEPGPGGKEASDG